MKTIEEKIEELEKISTEIEKENIGIDKSIESFENALAIAKDCFNELKATNGKITLLKKQMDEILEVPFSDKVE